MVLIRELPPEDRPRERLWNEGPGALTDRELLAILLRTGTKANSALTLADRILASAGGLAALARATPEELAASTGMGPAKSAVLAAAFELGWRKGRVDTSGARVRRAEDLAALVVPRLAHLTREAVLVVVLDGAQRLRRLMPISNGSSDSSPWPIREILNAVLRNDGRAFAVAHNHPSGELHPSREDVRSTGELAEASKIVGLRFLDHLIVSGEGWLSLRETGAV